MREVEGWGGLKTGLHREGSEEASKAKVLVLFDCSCGRRISVRVIRI